MSSSTTVDGALPRTSRRTGRRGRAAALAAAGALLLGPVLATPAQAATCTGYGPSTARISLCGAVDSAYRASGGASGPLGVPLSPELVGVEGPGPGVAFFKGGTIWALANGTTLTQRLADPARNRRAEALTLSQTAVPLFIPVAKGRAGTPDGFDWSTDGCSGPTYGDVERTFHDACVKHDFGSRNFSPRSTNKFDPTRARLAAINETFRLDAEASCVRAGQPRLTGGFGWPRSCRSWVPTLYQSVTATSAWWWGVSTSSTEA
ncbi:phospholipase A2 [Kineococcus gynurae]|uniref:Phospholipase A2 n=1 Tax=Kineococcus gynurae TaxID=452979 RepID=A0ABV5LP69_9ACTN